MYFGKVEKEVIDTPERFFKCLQLALELYVRFPPLDMVQDILRRATKHLYSHDEVKILCSYANYCSHPYDYLIDCVNAPRDYFANANNDGTKNFHIAMALAVGDMGCLAENCDNCRRWCDSAVKRGYLLSGPEDCICDTSGGTITKFDYTTLD